MSRPFLKWVGGKSRVLAQLSPFLPQFEGTYYEPFVGGGAMFFHLSPERAVLSDLNARLVNCYVQVRDNVREVIEDLTRHSNNHSQDHYYNVRYLLNDGFYKEKEVLGASAFIYLNKTGFNGLYRENKKGGFNVPFGHRERFCVDTHKLLEASKSLQGVGLEHCSFTSVDAEAKAGDFVYLDPPYVDTFNGYTGEGFGGAMQLSLSCMFEQIAQRGVHVMLSNSDTPWVRDLYANWRIEPLLARRSVSSKASGRGKSPEVVILSERA